MFVIYIAEFGFGKFLYNQKFNFKNAQKIIQFY